MIRHLRGTVSATTSQAIVIDVNGVGYEVIVPNPFEYPVNTEVMVFTYYHLREDRAELYGFKTIEERNLFEKFLSVRGIGPKGALVIIAGGDIQATIEAIETTNTSYLQRFPGIGPKASSQIILDLQGKLTPSKSSRHPKLNAIYEALESMGYTKREISKIDDYLLDNINLELNQLLKLALQKIK